jgi:hypothetical protein
MIKDLSSKTRRFIVNCRCLSMLGNVESALAQIDQALASGAEVPVPDQVALLSLKAELLYLDYREDESLDVFETSIEPKLGLVKQEYKFIAVQNRRNVSIAAFRVTNDRQADVLNDQQELLGAKLWDAPAMVHAYESAFEGRHYEALPALWRELVNSYHQGTWSHYRQASKRLTREFLQIGWAYVADFHAINSQSSELVDEIANNLLAWRKPDVTRAVVQRIMHQANLKRHSAIACKLLMRITDAIPDDQVDTLFKWLLSRATVLPSSEPVKGLLSVCWETLLSLTPRLTKEQARELVQTATTHESWSKKKADYLRPYLVQVVNECVSRLPNEDLPALAKGAIHMAPGMSQDVNYDKDVLNFFYHLSRRGDAAAKELIRDALYDSPSVNLDFVRIAKEFGKDVESSEQVRKMAEYFTKDVRLQVQHLAPDEEPIKPAVSLAMATAKSTERKTAVSVYVDMGLRAVIAYRGLLSSESIDLLLAAILDMLREPENILANKVLMINAITEMADTLTKEQAEEVFLALEPMAKGAIVGLDVSAAFGDPNHPLNPFKMNLGDPATIQGGALFALSSVESCTPGTYGERLLTLIEEGMTNPNAEVRGLAFMAARRMPVLSESAVMRTLLATRDDVSNVVEEALLTINTHFRDTAEFWNSIAYALNMAAQSPETRVRRAAAFTIRNLKPKCTSEIVENQLNGLGKLLAADSSFTVRKELSVNSVA